MEIKETPPISPDKSVVTPASPVADSGAPPADLAGLREWNASRNPSSIIADKVATLRERLADPSTPPAAIPGLEAAIRRVEKQEAKSKAASSRRRYRSSLNPYRRADY